MNAQSHQNRQQPMRRGSTPPRFGTPPGGPPPWRAPSAQRPSWGPRHDPLEGTVHAPRSTQVTTPRRRGRFLTVWVPSILGGGLGISVFMVLGVSSLIGGAGLLAPLLAGLGVGVVAGGGLGLLLRNRAPRTVRVPAAGEMPSGTRSTLETIARTSTQQRKRLARMRRHRPDPAVAPVLDRAEALLQKIDALVASGSLQSRRSSDADLQMLDGMAERYVPDLVGALEDTVGFLGPHTGGARDQAYANLRSIDQQLAVLGDRVERLENDLVAGVTRTLDVHSEFLRSRFPEDEDHPLLDR
ncbi:hypothetical protein [Brachybacterium sp. YJGR34]|uniref:hypothetical protein n=1 Tax=Brachybacterium sp. YJGR34 TaxID=2059911 RepID=UPI001E50A44C|nr:hypothetical protein [Brachybacterium sp. YJGR34]